MTIDTVLPLLAAATTVGFVVGGLCILTLAFFLRSSHTKSMPPTNQSPQQGAMPTNVNWPAVHAAFNDHMQNGGAMGAGGQPGQQPQPQVGGTQQPGPAQPGQPAIPQPEQNQPGYAMLIHAMGSTPHNPGEDPESMIIRALSDHLKRSTPDVSSLHKDAMRPATGGGAY